MYFITWCVTVYTKYWHIRCTFFTSLTSILNPCYQICVLYADPTHFLLFAVFIVAQAQLCILPIFYIYIYYFFYFAVVCILRTIWWLFLLGHSYISGLMRSAACMVHSLAVNLWPIGAWGMHMWACSNHGRLFMVIKVEKNVACSGWSNLSCHIFRAAYFILGRNLSWAVGFILGYALLDAWHTWWCTSTTQSSWVISWRLCNGPI